MFEKSASGYERSVDRSFATVAGEPAGRYRAEPGPCPRPVAAEVPVTLAAALDGLESALEVLAGVEVGEEPDVCVAQAAPRVQVLLDRLVGQQLRVVGAVDRRRVYAGGGAVSTTSWLAARCRLDHGEVAAKVEAARRLEALPSLRAQLEAGAVSFSHVREVTRAATPGRLPAVAAVEDALVELARRAAPRQVRAAMRHVREHVDADGSDAEPLAERAGAVADERRGLDLAATVDGLWALRATLDPLSGELLATLLDAYSKPDPPDLPEGERRTATQRRHDAFDALLSDAAASGVAPSRHGAVPHVLLMVDLLSLLGLVDQATRPQPRLRFGGATTVAVARALFAQAVKITAVATLGPWRVVALGATTRLLPGWLRPVLQMIHHRCRGPDCDRPAVWGDAHHVEDWDTHRNTDLNRTIPLCRAHHSLVTNGTWQVDYDSDSGVCTWTGPDGHTVTTHPPPP